MEPTQEIFQTTLLGWRTFQDNLIAALNPLTRDQKALKAAPQFCSVNQIARHIIGARASWFYALTGEGGEVFKRSGNWDKRGAPDRESETLVNGFVDIWVGMETARMVWDEAPWSRTWLGGRSGEPERIARAWVVWHLIEHELVHGGEISLTIGAHGIPAITL